MQHTSKQNTMTQQEFTNRTDYKPTPEEFVKIHDAYMATDLDKDLFCKIWQKMNGHKVLEQQLREITERRIAQLEEETETRRIALEHEEEYVRLIETTAEFYESKETARKTLDCQKKEYDKCVARLKAMKAIKAIE